MVRMFAAIAALAATLVVHASTGTVDLAVPGRANATPSIAASGETVAIVWGRLHRRWRHRRVRSREPRRRTHP